MATRRTRRNRGIGLLEVLIATVILVVASTGALSYEYHSARQMRIARAKASAVRIGYLLLEEWKANGGHAYYARGDGPYSPADLVVGLKQNKGDQQKLVNGVLTNTFEYEITFVGGVPMLIELSRPVNYSKLIQLTATMKWENQLVTLYTKARVDQAGG